MDSVQQQNAGSGANQYNFNNITNDEFLALFNAADMQNLSVVHGINSVTVAGSGGLSNDSLFLYNGNGTNITTTYFNGTYPSGYTLTHIVIASIIVTILMIVIVVGNMLVIIAIATEKSLKNIQNWFIASLAVADFFLGLVIMPFSLANELMGYWIFGSWWCDIHSAMDVLLCTASIMNLCLISLDRYWSITKAVEYLKSRTPARAAVMITAVWIMSGLICIPPLLGWKVKRPEGQALPQCELSEDIGYVLYSALGSFYIPSCIMVFVYIRIYFAAKARARRGIKKLPRKPTSQQVTSFTTSSQKGGTHPMPSVPSTSAQQQLANQQHNQMHQQQIATIETPPPTGSASMPIPIVTCDFASDISTSEAAECENQQQVPPSQQQHQQLNAKETLKVGLMVQQNNATAAGRPIPATNGTSPNELQVSPVQGRCRALSVGIDTDMPIFGRKNQRRNESKALKNSTKPCEPAPSELEPAIPKVQKPRDPEKEKRRIARKKEKRATLILGLIMGSFIACWLPFFFLYILTPACTKCKIPQSAFAVAFWLGYMNSALNPAIYTIFNKDFRRAFRRILFK